MPFNINLLLRKNILHLKPYSSARDEFDGEAGVFLDANENSLGSTLSNPLYSRYPDPLQKAIKKRVAELEKLDSNQIFLGNGSDEAIDLLIRAFCNPEKDSILIMPPTYGMYQVSADINAIQTIQVPLTSAFQIDVPAVLQAIDKTTKLIFICSPNNPSGNLLDRRAIQAILEYFEGILVIDEAYIDFANIQSWVNALPEYPNLVVLKTFSKAWGLAALRLGMAFASKEIIDVYNRIKPPYNINISTQNLALEALENTQHKQEMIAALLEERVFLEKALPQIACVEKVYPSDANFLLVKVTDANKIYHYLVNQKLIVRNRSNVMLCDNCLRITVGTHQENELLLEVMKKYQ